MERAQAREWEDSQSHPCWDHFTYFLGNLISSSIKIIIPFLTLPVFVEIKWANEHFTKHFFQTRKRPCVLAIEVDLKDALLLHSELWSPLVYWIEWKFSKMVQLSNILWMWWSTLRICTLIPLICQENYIIWSYLDREQNLIIVPPVE